MPFGGLLSIAGPMMGIGSSLAGLFGGTPSQNVQAPQGFQMPNMGGAANSAFGSIPGLSNYNVAGNLLPQYQGIAQNVANNPYSQGYVGNSAATGAAGMGAGAALTGSSLSQLPNVQALMNLGFDPQNALYNQLQNTNQQQNQAILGQSGVANTPYGAGVTQQSNNQFNMNWENQQLGRASQAAGAAGGLLGSIGQGTNTGLQQMAQGAQLPYSAYTGTQTDALSALAGTGQFGSLAGQVPQQQIQDYLQYLGAGTGQQNANTGLFNSQLGQANQTFNQQQTLSGQLGGGLAGLAKGWGNMGTSPMGGGTGGFATNSWAQNNPGVAGSGFYGPVMQ